MKTRMYCVKDSKSGLFSNPMHETTDEIAVRAFVAQVGATDNPLADYPEDFVLYRVGEWDNEKGMFIPENPYSLISGIEALRKGREKAEKLEALHKEIEELKDA